jgi:hypothetical protein
MDERLAVDEGKRAGVEPQVGAALLTDGDSAMFAVLESEPVILKKADACKSPSMGQGYGFLSLSLAYPFCHHRHNC